MHGLFYNLQKEKQFITIFFVSFVKKDALNWRISQSITSYFRTGLFIQAITYF